jgi:hypothetical protein
MDLLIQNQCKIVQFGSKLNPPAPSYPAVLEDGNTVAWYDYTQASTLTADGSNLVSRWNDRLLSGRDLIQETGTNQPLLTADGVLFDGVDNRMKAAAFTLNQPEYIYLVLKNVVWIKNREFMDGNGVASSLIQQNNTKPNILTYAGLTSSENTNLSENTWSVIRFFINGDASKLQINETTATTGNFGSEKMGGFTLGCRANLSQHSNIQVKEIIIRKVADNSTDETAIYNYLKTKYSL